jgi:hypothetical protein
MDYSKLTVTQVINFANQLSIEDKRTLISSVDVDTDFYMDLIEDTALLKAMEANADDEVLTLHEAKLYLLEK